ncbi:uncharacterized protein LOC120303163 isoform X1 [Crotalus tigris]|uniref:uncharacterized protein LOC120303163 isoform X1 n=1 Tax=Crotalus tigris TaxID=88082 RepID=UPI00192F976E|nr:uncharacterized protein LOC120303163 isoform X1 [Crotalus tigris]
MGRPAGFSLLTAAALWWSWGAQGQVYYSCGAQFSSWERGLILSPGFPNNYSSGMHCVWRFLIPAKTYLLLEIFDFDVFESTREDPKAWDGYFSFTKNTNSSPKEEITESSSTVFPAKTSVPPDLDSADLNDGLPGATSQNLEWKEFHPSGEPKDVTQPSQFPIQEETNKTLTRQTSVGKQEKKDSVDKIFFAHYPNKENAKGPQKHLGKVIFGEDAVISTMILPGNISSTPPFSADVCPDDVLYVSDLVAFSSRFCGTKSPLNQNMTFGSSLKMVEVIVELITTTDRGRGFAMLFEYKNGTEVMPTNDIQDGEENTMMLVIITGILFFAMVLLSSLCIACRWRLCLKRSSLEVHSDQETQIQNSGVDVSELQLVIPCQENENNNHSLGENGVVTSCPGNLEPIIDLEASPTSAVMGSDEVFIISANPEPGSLSFTSCKIQPKKLTRSITSPTSVSEWLIPTPTEPGGQASNSRGENPKEAYGKQQTWRARTFHDLLAPFPQLQEQWCNWTTKSPFPKLSKSGGFSTSTPTQPIRIPKVTSAGEIEGTSEGSPLEGLASTASSPWTHSAQKPQKLTGCSNSRRSQFAKPSFDFLTGSPGRSHLRLHEHSELEGSLSPVNSPHLGEKDAPDGALRSKSDVISGSKPKEASVDMDGPKPMFVISEEWDDQQPLVLAEHTNQCVDVLSETNAVLCERGMAMRKEQMVELSLEEGPEEATGSSLGMGLWGEPSSPYQDVFKGDRNETYAPAPKPESPARLNSGTCPNVLF